MQFSPQGGNGTVFAPSDAGAGGRTPRIIITWGNLRRGDGDAVLGKIKIAVRVGVEQRPDGNLVLADLNADDDAKHGGIVLHGKREQLAQMRLVDFGAGDLSAELLHIVRDLRALRLEGVHLCREGRAVQPGENSCDSRIKLL